jgi:hypothetical protein
MTWIIDKKYYIITVNWRSGFKHTIPCTSVDLKTELKLLSNYDMVDSYTYKEVSEEKYNKRLNPK